jgi:hypothetical protein
MGDDNMQEYDQEQRAAICYSTYRERCLLSLEGKSMAYPERLHELKRKRALLRQKLDPYLEADRNRPDGEKMPEEDQNAFEAIMAELQELEERIARCERAMSASAPVDETRAANGDDDEKPKDDDDDKDDDKGYRGPGMTARLRSLAGNAGVMTRGGLRVGECAGLDRRLRLVRRHYRDRALAGHRGSDSSGRSDHPRLSELDAATTAAHQ